MPYQNFMLVHTIGRYIAASVKKQTIRERESPLGVIYYMNGLGPRLLIQSLSWAACMVFNLLWCWMLQESGRFVEFTHKHLTLSTCIEESYLCRYVNIVAKHALAPRIVCILRRLEVILACLHATLATALMRNHESTNWGLILLA